MNEDHLSPQDQGAEPTQVQGVPQPTKRHWKAFPDGAVKQAPFRPPKVPVAISVRAHHEEPSIRPRYEEQGVVGYYSRFGSSYRNPHEVVIRALLHRVVQEWRLDLGKVLDLACGSGEVTLALRELGGVVGGIDPYTGAAFLERTGTTAEALSFDDVMAGALETRRYSLIVCSFALHLAETSKLPALTHQLARLAPQLLVLTPHKRPELKSKWGWELKNELLEYRVRARLYHSRVMLP